MRPDMGKIAVDAYRHGGYQDKKRTSKLRRGRNRDDVLEGPTVISPSRHRQRHPGENLSPLYRWLDKQVGRPWNDVYSEIVRTLQGGYANLEHIKHHVLQRVERGEIRMIGGWPHTFYAYSYGRRDPWRELDRDDLYVDEKGALRQPPKNKESPSERRKRERKRRPDIIMIDALTAASKINGVWFIADLFPIPEYESKEIDYTRCSPFRNPDKIVYHFVMRRQRIRDVLVEHVFREKRGGRWINTSSDTWDFASLSTVPYDREKLYAPSIRTMSKKEIKQRIPEALR